MIGTNVALEVTWRSHEGQRVAVRKRDEGRREDVRKYWCVASVQLPRLNLRSVEIGGGKRLLRGFESVVPVKWWRRASSCVGYDSSASRDSNVGGGHNSAIEFLEVFRALYCASWC